MNINAPGFCNWLSGVLEMNETLTPDQLTLVKSRLSDAFLHDIDQTFPAEQQEALQAAHIGVKFVNGVKMGKDGVTPDSGLHWDTNSHEYDENERGRC